MSLKMKVSDTTTPTSLGGGMVLGAAVGVIVGGIFGPQILFSADYRYGIALILARVFCACLGFIAGFFGGGLIDLWLAPRVEKTIQNAAGEAVRHQHRGEK